MDYIQSGIVFSEENLKINLRFFNNFHHNMNYYKTNFVVIKIYGEI